MESTRQTASGEFLLIYETADIEIPRVDVNRKVFLFLDLPVFQRLPCLGFPASRSRRLASRCWQ